jgi:hypothetical protein
MARVAVPELEDYAWFPASLRDALTGFLSVASDVLGLHRVAAPLVREALARGGERRIVDLCSGGGGPALSLAQELRRLDERSLSVVLTDKYPNRAAFQRAEREQPDVTGLMEPTDASAVPGELRGVRTLFNALHHLPEAVARAMFEDAAAQRQPIVTCELVERSLQGAAILLGIPATTYTLMPFVKPRSALALALTYAAPVVPAAVLWDGFASCMRAYSTSELHDLVLGLDRPGYRFRVERRRIPGRPLFVSSVVGLPC